MMHLQDKIQGNVQLGSARHRNAIILRAQLISRLQINSWMLSAGMLSDRRVGVASAASAHHVGNQYALTKPPTQ